jgi:DNA-binding transcriptional LysR family regulator
MNIIHDERRPISSANLAAVDLNLLFVFDALARERSVTRAAEQLGVTQSALSHALRRLRQLFEDPLLVRGTGGLVLTPRAESLVGPVRSGLSSFGRALAQPDPFDPRRSRRGFVLASPDVFDVLVLPKLLARLQEEAPGIDLTIVPLSPRILGQQLETGEIDVAIVPRFDMPKADAPGQLAGLRQRALLRDKSSCLLRRNHPLLRERRKRRAASTLSLQHYVALSHVLVSPAGAGPGPVDHALAELGLARRIALRLPHFASAMTVVAQSDLVLTAPSTLAELGRAQFGLEALAAPLKVPAHHVNMTWHERFTEEPGHTWFRTLLSEITRGLGGD